MPEPLRPMSTGELLDRTFALYKRNLLLFVAIAVPAPALYLVFQLLVTGSGAVHPILKPSTGQPAIAAGAILGVIAVGLVGLFIYMLGWAITSAAAIRAVSAVHLGRSITAREAYASLKGRYLRILGVFLLAMVIVLGGSVLLYGTALLITFAAISSAAKLGTLAAVIGGIVGFAGIIASVVLAIALYVRYSLSVQACVIEDIPIVQSLKRSAFLAKRSSSRILTVYTVFVVLQLVIGFTLGFGLVALVSPLHSIRLNEVMSALAAFIGGVLSGPLATIAMSLVYYDERVRKEAFDLQLMMAALDEPQSAAISAT
jgi:hypothetical protein